MRKSLLLCCYRNTLKAIDYRLLQKYSHRAENKDVAFFGNVANLEIARELG